MKLYILSDEKIRGIFEAGRDYELHWNANHEYPADKGIDDAFEREVPAWATHFYGGDKAYMNPCRGDLYEEIP